MPDQDIYFGATAIWLMVGWSFLLGSAIGSFLNVVAYRLPLGLNLSRPGSRCPNCERPIRWYHNVPIFGWLMLRGRCADCYAPISMRYPIVEFIVALASGILAWSATLPATSAGGSTAYGVDPVLVFYHLVLLWTLLAAALLEWDGNQIPIKFLALVLALGIATPLFHPEVFSEAGEIAQLDVIILDQGVNLAAASLLGLLAWPLLVQNGSHTLILTGATRMLQLLAVGVFLGYWNLLPIAAGGAALFLANKLASMRWPRIERLGWSASLVTAMLVWLVATSLMLGSHRVTIDHSPPRQAIVWIGLAVAALSIAGRLFYTPPPEERV